MAGRCVAPASCGDGRVDDVALALRGRRAVFQFKSVLSDAHWSRARVVACQKLWGSPSGHFVCADVGHRPNHPLWRWFVEVFLSSRIEHRFVYGNRWFSDRFRPLLGAASSGRRSWSFRHSASRPGRGMVRRRGVRVRVHSTLVLSRVGNDKSEPHSTQEESGPSSDPRTPRRRRSIKQKRRLR